MLELIIIVLLCCNKDGSKKGIINCLSVVGLILSLFLIFLWTPIAAIDMLLYLVFMLIGNAQGEKKDE